MASFHWVWSNIKERFEEIGPYLLTRSELAMPTPIEAVYEHGVLRPDRPIDLAEGARVEIIVLPMVPAQSAENCNPARKNLAEFVAEMAALPIESAPDGFSGEDHDEVLYGWKKPR